MSQRKITVISYLLFCLVLVTVGCLQMAAPLITVLFAYFALNKLNFLKRKWLAVLLFLVAVACIFSGFVIFLKTAWIALPDIVSRSIPKVVDYAQRHEIELPFTDMESLKDLAMDSVKGTLGYLGNFAKIATKEFLFLVVGVVVAIGMFLNPTQEGAAVPGVPRNNLYTLLYGALARRFRAFYRCFEMVMGAQLLISLINTVLTSIFVTACSLRYAGLVIILTFLCGLLPIVGNLISNAIIVGLAFTVSPTMAVSALVFLVLIHKLEYFLNSKIIGARIRHPMWLMLLALIFGERLIGIPGLILAPVAISFLREELMQFGTGPDGRIARIAP